MLHLLNHVAPVTAASEHAVNEQLAAAAPFIGMLAFAVFVGLLLITASYSSRGKSPEIGEYQDLIANGVIDPVKVTRSALANAASIASLLLTTETLVVDKKEDDDSK